MGAHRILACASFAVCFSALGQETVRQLETRAAALKARGDAAGALAAWEKAAELDPRSASIQDEIGFLLAVLNRRDEATQRVERSLELDRKFAPAHYHLGVAKWLEQKPDEAILHLQTAVALNAKNFEYRYYLGQALNATSRLAEALEHLEAAAK